MNLSKKLTILSVAIALVLMIFLLVYFVLLMPNLYLAHQRENSIRIATALHEGYLKERSYRNLVPDNYLSNFSVVVPKTGYDLRFSNKFGDAEIKLTTDTYRRLLDSVREIYRSASKMDAEEEQVSEDIEALFQQVSLPVLDGIEIAFRANAPVSFRQDAGSRDFYPLKDGILIANTLKQDGLEYVSIIALTERDNEYIFTMLPTIYDSMAQIMPVVMGSLPMILLGILIITVLASQYFAHSVIVPILRIQNHAYTLKSLNPSKWSGLHLEGKDEIAMLSQRLDEVHEELKKHYENITAEKNRQELFVRASSHELKTPLASALLLCDGMIAKIGKYADVEQYLPELKKILLSMQKMLQEILLIRSNSEVEYAMTDFRTLAEGIAEQNRILCEERGICIHIEGSLHAKTWPDLAQRVMETLIGNAVLHGEENSSIHIRLSEEGFVIQNRGHIDERIRNNLFEPFVTGEHSKGHGLGLYIVRSYAKLLQWQISIDNDNEGVRAICKMK